MRPTATSRSSTEQIAFATTTPASPCGVLGSRLGERRETVAEQRRDVLRLARAVLRPGPEEAAQPVALSPRHDVHVEVGHALADDVVVGDERAFGAERARQDAGDALDALEERADVGPSSANVTT